MLKDKYPRLVYFLNYNDFEYCDINGSIIKVTENDDNYTVFKYITKGKEMKNVLIIKERAREVFYRFNTETIIGYVLQKWNENNSKADYEILDSVEELLKNCNV